MTPFEREVEERLRDNATDEPLQAAARSFLVEAARAKYSYNFFWLGRPIIQYPQDMVAVQELIWDVRPDLVIETGIAHGGSLILSASILALLDYCDAEASGGVIDTRAPRRRVVGIDIDIREHNRAAMERHPMRHRIEMIEGSSIDSAVVGQVHEIARRYERVLLFLDSNHTHDHVLAELEAYAPLTSKGSYCVVFDTIVEDLPDELCADRPWRRGNSPLTAVREYLDRLETHPRHGADGEPLRFRPDEAIENKLVLTVARGGFLRRV